MSKKWLRLRNKWVAKRLWREGKEIGLMPSNMYPGIWMTPCPVKADRYVEHIEYYWKDVYPECDDIIDAAWRSMYNNWAYYNTCSEMGYYAHYYIKAEDAVNGDLHDEWGYV